VALSSFFLRFGVIAAAAGIGMGIAMGATHQFTLATVHAHLNLLGWVSMFLYGLFYRVEPRAADGLLPGVHAICATLGLVIFVPALGLQLAGPPTLAPAAMAGLVIGPFLVLLGMIVFAIIVFRATSSVSGSRA